MNIETDTGAVEGRNYEASNRSFDMAQIGTQLCRTAPNQSMT